MNKLSCALTIMAALSLNIVPAQAVNKQLEVSLKSSLNSEQNQIEKINNSSSSRYCFRLSFGRLWCLPVRDVE